LKNNNKRYILYFINDMIVFLAKGDYMDSKELANLIFPNVKGTQYYEKMYPERNLKDRSSSSKSCS